MLLAIWLWLAAPPSAPAEAPATVRWTAPPGCPSEAEFVQRVEELGVDARLTASFEFVVESEGGGEGKGKQRGSFTLHVRGQPSRYVAERCDALVDTALLLVSLALVSAPVEPAAAEPEPEPESRPGPRGSRRRSPSAAERRREADDVAPFLRADRRSKWLGPNIGLLTAARLRAEVGATSGVTPTAAPELFVGAGPRGGVWAVDVGMLARPQFVAMSPQPNIGANMTSVGGLLRVCAGPRLRRLSVGACAGAELAVVTASPRGDVVDARVGRRPWLLVSLGPDFAVPVSRRVALVTHVAGTWLAVRPVFDIAEAGQVCCRNSLGLTARVGVEIGLGR